MAVIRWSAVALSGALACSGGGDDGISSDAGPRDAAAAEQVAVTVLVHGDGTVVSSPAGIECRDACAAYFDAGAPIVLTAMADEGWELREFQGACTGSQCSVTATEDAVVDVYFQGAAGTGWFLPVGNDADDELYAVVLVDGGPVVVGEYYGAIDLGGGPIGTDGVAGIFVARYDSSGGFVWAKAIDGPGLLAGSPAAVTPAGDVLITGAFGNTTDFGGQSLTSVGRSDFFVAKLAGATGDLLWVNGNGGTEIDFGRAVASDADGNALVTGYYRRSIDFGEGPIDGAYWGSVFVAKYADADGSLVWATVDYPDEGLAEGTALVADPAGDVIVVGLHQPDTDFPDGFVSKLSGVDGSPSWKYELDPDAASVVNGVTASAGGDVFIAGQYRGAMDVEGTSYVSGMSDDLFVMRLSPSGAVVWFTDFGGDGYDYATYIALRPDGNLSISGGFSERVTFAPGAFVLSVGALDALHAVVDPAGQFVSAFSFGGAGDDSAEAVAVDADRLVLGGTFSGPVDIRGVVYESSGAVDGYIHVREEGP